jgi:hypothetical protein
MAVLNAAEWVLNPRYWPILLTILIAILGLALWASVSKAGPAPHRLAAVLVILLVLVGVAGTWLNWQAAMSPEQLTIPTASAHYFTPAELAAQWNQVTVWDGQKAQPVSNVVQPYAHGPGVAYNLKAGANQVLEYDIRYAAPVRADGVTAHFYLPREPGLETNWVGLAAVDAQDRWLASAGRPVTYEEWVPITLDLRGQYDADSRPLNAGEVFVKAVYKLKGLPSAQGDSVHQVGLAGVSLYDDLGALSIREQRGGKRTLLDFEKEGSSSGWRSLRGETDRLSMSTEIVYRGTQALEVDTAGIGGSDYATISTQATISSPRGIWLAEVFLPAAEPSPGGVWAKLFSNAGGAWVAGEPQYLTPGAWNTVTWDTRGIDWGAQQDITLGIQFGAKDAYRGPLYVDDYQVFRR